MLKSIINSISMRSFIRDDNSNDMFNKLLYHLMLASDIYFVNFCIIPGAITICQPQYLLAQMNAEIP